MPPVIMHRETRGEGCYYYYYQLSLPLSVPESFPAISGTGGESWVIQRKRRVSSLPAASC